MTPVERARLRLDYKRMIPPEPRHPQSALGYGLLFPLLDDSARLALNMVNRTPEYPDEWNELAKHPAMWRKRHPDEVHA